MQGENVSADLVMQLLERVEMLETYDKERERVLKIHDDEYQREIKGLRNELVSQKQQMSVMRSYMDDLKTKLSIKTDILSQESTHDTTQHSIKNSRGRKSLMFEENEEPIAFFSTLNNHLHNIGQNQTIAFDKVITNIGNAYNPHIGSFVAPVSGLYVFSVTLMAESSDPHFRVFWNSTPVSSIYIRGNESPYMSSSHMAILQMKKGDDVAIKSWSSNEDVHGDNYSTFSGFLLQQSFDDSSPIIGK